MGVFDFDGAAGADLIVKVAISPVSEEGAIANLDAEMPGWDFDAVRAAARQQWSQALGVFEVEAPERGAHAASSPRSITRSWRPSLFMDSDGRYRGPDNAVHQAQGFTNYSTFSLWDTYRALHPLLTHRAAAAAHQRHRALAARRAAGQPLRHAAGVGVPGPGDLVHDRLPRRRGDRGRLR